MDELYRFSELTAVGNYNASCRVGALQSDRKEKCPSHTSEYTVQYVEQVHARPPAASASFDRDRSVELVEAADSETEAIISRYRSTLEPWRRENELASYRVLRPEPRGRVIYAFLCFCERKSCEGKWPRRFGEAFDSPNNPYECLAALLGEGEWWIDFDPERRGVPID